MFHSNQISFAISSAVFFALCKGDEMIISIFSQDSLKFFQALIAWLIHVLFKRELISHQFIIFFALFSTCPCLQ